MSIFYPFLDEFDCFRIMFPFLVSRESRRCEVVEFEDITPQRGELGSLCARAASLLKNGGAIYFNSPTISKPFSPLRIPDKSSNDRPFVSGINNDVKTPSNLQINPITK